MAQKVFKRVEKKYLLDEKKYNELLRDLLPYMEIDEYGLHTIQNIYFDTDDDVLIRTSLEKPKYKEKFRIRCYGEPGEDGECFLELKKKYGGTVYKRRIELSIAEARAYIYEGKLPEYQGQIFHEIDYFLHHYDVKPKRYLAYDRIALFATYDPEFRITFDTNIRSRVTNLSFLPDEDDEYLLDEGVRLMEVKVSGAMPLWFARSLSEHEIYSTSFSKYGKFYEKQVEEEFEEGIYTSVDMNCIDESYEEDHDWSHVFEMRHANVQV